MVCVLCRDFLFGFLVKDESGTSNTRRIAALNCGHTFHLDCITLWLDNDENTKCPMCSAYPVGPILALYIKCDMDHVVNDKLIDYSLWAIKQQEAYCMELEVKMAALRIKSHENVEPLRKIQARLTEVHKNITLLETQENELSTLSESHRADVQSSIDLMTQVLSSLQQKNSEQDAEPA
ncbi:hypothetical protein GGH93_003274 [Coemansia aciculifera]|nr:hypothetical protein GGH93_003274 [Coemansia aciculifera]